MKELIVFSIIMLAIDYVWLTNIMSIFYRTFFSKINVKSDVRIPYALMAYLLMILGYNYFVKNTSNKLYNSFVFGAILFGVYGFTVGALFKDYSWKLALLETLWGGILYTLTTYLTDKII